MAQLNDDIKLFSGKHVESDENLLQSTNARSSMKQSNMLQEWTHEPTNLIINQPSSPTRPIPRRAVYTQAQYSRTGAEWNKSRDDGLMKTAVPSPRSNQLIVAQKRRRGETVEVASFPTSQKVSFRGVMKKRKNVSRPQHTTPSCDLFYNSLFI